MKTHEELTKDTMWAMFKMGNQKPNISALEKHVNTLIRMTAQKTAGQRKGNNDISWEMLDITLLNIAIEATALVLSGNLKKIKEMEELMHVD